MNALRVGRCVADAVCGGLRVVTIATLLLGGTARAATADLVWLDDRAAVHQFVDGVVASQVARGDVVGATVSITRGGELVLAQGYGLADRAAFRAVDAQETLFRIGSVSKVLVWMAVMQQVAAGQLDLDADVNSYLTDPADSVYVSAADHADASDDAHGRLRGPADRALRVRPA